MAALPVGKGYTPAQWEAWFNANSVAANPKYTGNAKAGMVPLAGKTWAQVYAAVYAAGGATPDQAGAATEALAAEEALAIGVGSAVSGAANATNASAVGISTASILPSWASSLATLLGNLTAAATWVRVAKVVIGGALVIIGLSHMTGASNAVARTARKVPVIV